MRILNFWTGVAGGLCSCGNFLYVSGSIVENKGSNLP